METNDTAPEIATQPLPLENDTDGVVRVGGTRVTLDTIVTAFKSEQLYQ